MKASDFETMPLCLEHHLGNSGIHGLGRKSFEARYGVTQRELVQRTQKILGYVDGQF